MIYPTTPRQYSAADLALIEERAAAAKRGDWAFSALTPMQARAKAAQEAAMREAAAQRRPR